MCLSSFERKDREDWLLANSEIFRFKNIPAKVKRGEQRVKAVAGLIRAVVLKQDNQIYDLVLTGDFHPRPYTVLTEMEAALRKAPAQPEEIEKRIRGIWQHPGVEISGTTPEDFISAVVGALGKAS